jgi:hypothetical protein
MVQYFKRERQDAASFCNGSVTLPATSRNPPLLLSVREPPRRAEHAVIQLAVIHSANV